MRAKWKASSAFTLPQQPMSTDNLGDDGNLVKNPDIYVRKPSSNVPAVCVRY
jgi:hypothetical protein